MDQQVGQLVQWLRYIIQGVRRISGMAELAETAKITLWTA